VELDLWYLSFLLFFFGAMAKGMVSKSVGGI